MAAGNSLGLASILLGIATAWFPGPVGGAPLDLDPKLSAIAPADCLWYFSTSGQGTPDPNSANQTEQLLAEPQIQRLFVELKSTILKAIEKAPGPPDHQKDVLLAQAPKLLRALFTRPLTVYVERVVPSEAGADVEAAFVLNAGDQRADIEAALKEILALKPADAPPITTETLAGYEWQKPTTPPGAPTARFGWMGDYFVFAVGDATPQKLKDRLNGTSPDWLTKIRNEHPIEREMSVGYLNIAAILKIAKPFMDKDDPKAWPSLEKLGLTAIDSAHGIAGYDKEGCAQFSHLVTNGKPTGVLAMLPHLPMESADFSRVPKDAMIAMAVKLSPAELLDQVLKLAVQFEPDAEAKFNQGLAMIQQQVGINVRQDVVDSLGDTWTVYLPGGDLFTSWMNIAVGAKVKDPSKLRSAMAKIVDIANGQLQADGKQASIDSTDSGSLTIYTLRTKEPMPFAPSWSIGDDWLAAGLSSQAVRAALERKTDDSLAASPVIAAAVGGAPAPSAISYQDTAQWVRSAYPLLVMGVQMASSQMKDQGIEFDASVLPTVEVILKHLQPSVSRMTAVDDGYLFEARGTAPAGVSAASAAPIAVALLLPAVQAAREAARRNKSLNNERQIALAMLNYESAHKTYPPFAKFDESGKPLLSWRVMVLPYLEQQELFSRFHLDEPWDSEHNKSLIAEMPAIYLDPSSQFSLRDGKTSYLAVKGKDFFATGDKEGRSLRSITDGTSNTIAVLQVNDRRTETWTKPADWEFNDAAPLDGLGGPHPGIFLATFCDGSVRAISANIAGDSLKKMLTTSGGEIVDQ